MDLCHGVALDILPIEGYAPGNLARKWQVIEGKIFQLFCTQVIPTKERHGAFMHYLGTILLALAPTQKMRYRIWKRQKTILQNLISTPTGGRHHGDVRTAGDSPEISEKDFCIGD